MNRPASHIIIIITAICSCVCSAPAADSSVVASAETFLIRQQYDSAVKCLGGVRTGGPEELFALYLRTAIEQTRLLDYESYHIHGEEYLRFADSVRTVLEQKLQGLSGGDSTLCLFYIANIYGGMSVIKAKMGSWFPALKGSLTSVGLLKETIRRDSTLYAAMLGIGVFHYYVGKSFTWLPFIDQDSNSQGVREIEMAASARPPFDFAAKNTLCWILIDLEEFARADSIALSVLQEVPQNTIFLRIRCMIAYWSGNYENALELGQKLAEASLMRNPVNWSDYVMAYYVLSGSCYELNRLKEAFTAIRHILGVKIPREYRELPPVRKNLKRILEVKKKCLR